MNPYLHPLKRWVAGLCLCLAWLPFTSAQNIAVKSNLLYDLTATMNLGAELKVAPRWTVDLSGNYNPFIFSDGKRWKHWLVQPEARCWLDEAFKGHFIAAHALGGQFNVADIKPLFGLYPSVEDVRVQGTVFGAGLGYGYQLPLGYRWNLELEVGAGWMHADYDKFEGVRTSKLLEKNTKDLFGLTKVAVSLVYVLRPAKTGNPETVTVAPLVNETLIGQTVAQWSESPVIQEPLVAEASSAQPTLPEMLPVATSEPVTVPEPVLKHETVEMTIQFPVNEYRVMENWTENKESLNEIRRLLTQDESVDTLWIYGYASPDGPEDFNRTLSEKRAKNLAEYLQRQGVTSGIKHMETIGMGESWQDLEMAVTNDENLPQRKEVLQVIDRYATNPEEGERILKTMPEVYDYLKMRIFPFLRKNVCRIKVVKVSTNQ